MIRPMGRNVAAEPCSSTEAESAQGGIIRLLTIAYWMKIESVMNYCAAACPSGFSSGETADALAQDTSRELDHAQRLATRIWELKGNLPASLSAESERPFHPLLARGASAEARAKYGIAMGLMAVDLYHCLIDACDAVDRVTQTVVIDILREEERQLRRLENALVAREHATTS